LSSGLKNNHRKNKVAIRIITVAKSGKDSTKKPKIMVSINKTTEITVTHKIFFRKFVRRKL